MIVLRHHEIRARLAGWLGRLTLGVILVAAFASQGAADVVIGGTNAVNGFPFGGTTYLGEYQQVYAASAFPGSVMISAVSFQTSPGFANPSTPQSLAFSLGLSTTSAGPNTLSTNYAANKGADFATVFSGTFTYTPLLNNTFDFVVPVTPFTYNPGLGNLLLDFVITTSAVSQVVFFAGNSDPLTSRAFNLGGNGPADADSGGLLTSFATGPVGASVPEPSSLILAGMGGLITVACARRRLRRAG
jgi:PEP-CTERM motif